MDFKLALKLLIGSMVLIGLIAIFTIDRRDKSNIINDEIETNDKQIFYSIDDGNQNSLIVGQTITKEWLETIKDKYSWDDFHEYDNRLWEYMDEIFDKMADNTTKEDYGEYDNFWNVLTREQKVFWTFLVFNGDTDNGGVYQFIFNRPEFIFAVSEMWNELGMHKISRDYEKVLEELTGKSGKISELKTVFNDESKSMDERWDSFSEGYGELKTKEKIEAYYYDKEFKKSLYQKMADYIEQNIDKFAKIEP